jgi:hypothetical protein
MNIKELVAAELERISDPALLARIRELLVEPVPVEREWDYGPPGQHFTCWTVLEHRPSNTGVAYCAQGFGPSCPWGLVFLSGSHTNIGMDCSWYETLQDAVQESMFWADPNRDGHEAK